MSKAERLYRIERMIRAGRCVSFASLQRELEVSRATLHRDLQYLRDRLGAPIVFDAERQGYRFADDAEAMRHELPGLWFDESELYALLLARELLGSIDADAALGRHLQPLLERIHKLLSADDNQAQRLLQRVLILTPAKRPTPAPFFELVVSALLQGRRIELDYFSRARGVQTHRVLSPQRLVHYRNTWYVDAWCHEARELRRFALDAFERANLLDDKVKDVPIRSVQRALDAGYGAFVGKTAQWATLVFAPAVAKWVAKESWHPQQTTRWLDDGSYELKVPFADPLELAMDVMRFGPDVQVTQPDALRELVRDRLGAAAARYASSQPDSQAVPEKVGGRALRRGKEAGHAAAR